LLLFVLLLPLFIFIEKKAQDPILNLKYFTTPKILITLVVGFFVGICMMGMIFVPQFSENALHIATGKGGYFVTILGVFTAIGAPMSGRLVDRYGAGKVLTGGFLVSLAGSLFLALIATQVNNLAAVLISLALIGTGLGFVMGSPLNYMMLGNTRKEQANSALATLSLVRSIGTIIAPSIMIGFLAQSGVVARDNLMSLLPQPSVPAISQTAQVNKNIEQMKKDPRMAEMLKDVNIPDLNNLGTMNFDMSSGKAIPEEALKALQSADVTNIAQRAREFSEFMYGQNTPEVIAGILEGLQKGIAGLNQGITGIDAAISQMETGNTAGGPGSPNIDKAALQGAVKGMKAQKALMADTVVKMEDLKKAVPQAFEQSQKDYLKKIDLLKPELEKSFQNSLSTGFQQMYITVAVFCVLSILLLLFYREPEKSRLKSSLIK
jgi:hypothetical protein